MRRLIPLTLSAVLVLPACSGGGGPEPVELPQLPPGVPLLEDPALEAELETVQEAVRVVGGTSVEAEVIFDLTDGGRRELIDYYDEQLTADGWEPSTGAPDIRGSLGSSWRREGLSIVLVTVADLDGRDLALLIPPVLEES